VVSIEKAKQILNNENKKVKYTDEEVKEIMNFLEVYASTAINNLKRKASHEKCNSLRKGFH
jgi:hypothetical protein